MLDQIKQSLLPAVLAGTLTGCTSNSYLVDPNLSIKYDQQSLNAIVDAVPLNDDDDTPRLLAAPANETAEPTNKK